MRCSNSTILLALSVWDVALLLSYLFSYGFPSLFGDYSDVNSRFTSSLSPYIYLYGTRALRKAGKEHTWLTKPKPKGSMNMRAFQNTLSFGFWEGLWLWLANCFSAGGIEYDEF
jgi:hypothetical protein